MPFYSRAENSYLCNLGHFSQNGSILSQFFIVSVEILWLTPHQSVHVIDLGTYKFHFQGLPKTSYYKLVDYWLSFCLNSLVLTLIFHTYLAHVVSAAKKKPFSLNSGTRFFSARQDVAINQNCNVLKKAKQLNKAGKIMFVLLSVFSTLFFGT